MAGSLSPDTHPRHRRYRSSPDLEISPIPFSSDPLSSLASPILECFPPNGQSCLSPTPLVPLASAPNPDPFSCPEDPEPDPDAGNYCNEFSNASRSLDSSAQLDVPFASPRSKIPTLSSQIEVAPSRGSLDCKRLYSEVAAAPTGSTPCSSAHLQSKLAAAVLKVLPDPTSKDLRILKSG